MAKTMLFDQWAELCGKVMYALPRDMDATTAQDWIDNPESLATTLRSTLMPDVEEQPEPEMHQLPTYPEVGEIFIMTLDGDLVENEPIQMVREDGHSELHKWNHKGPTVKGKSTRRFKFVEIGYQPDFASVKTELAKHGKIPEGQWRNAVKKNFRTNGRPMGVADASWVVPGGRARFPYIDYDGESGFSWAVGDFYDGWLWLVEVE